VDEPASLRVAAADLTDLAAIRAFVRTTATALDASPDAVPDLVLAVDEAVTNIIRHGYGGRTGPIGIEVGRDDGAIVVRVTDEATPFDPTTWPAPDLDVPLERRAAGGLGIHLVRTSVDRLTHRAVADHGNELILVKVDGRQGGNGSDEHDG
jgi:serine/threonine-protein kinase RsbW